jgi:hypothetical protein
MKIVLLLNLKNYRKIIEVINDLEFITGFLPVSKLNEEDFYNSYN